MYMYGCQIKKHGVLIKLNMMNAFAAVLFAAVAVTGARADFPAFTEHYFTQTVDHFRYSNNTATYQQRYLMNDQHFTGAGALSIVLCGMCA